MEAETENIVSLKESKQQEEADTKSVQNENQKVVKKRPIEDSKVFYNEPPANLDLVMTANSALGSNLDLSPINKDEENE